MVKIGRTVRSISPRLESIYSLSRASTAVAILAWVINQWGDLKHPLELSIGLGVFVAQFVVVYLAWQRKSKSSDAVYSFAFIFDILFTTFLIKFTGGAESSFYLLYYLTVMFAAYYFTLNYGLGAALAITSLYILTNRELITQLFIVDLWLRLGFVWFIAFAVGSFARQMKQSERKLLKLLDSLNESTTELERSQVRVETIYETSRTLGEIHDREGITGEVLNIVDDILGYECCSILMQAGEAREFQEIARLEKGSKKILYTDRKVALFGAEKEVVTNAVARRIVDLDSSGDYIPIMSGTRSALLVPMISNGRVIGMLKAESCRISGFNDMDQRVFSILAASAAMAYENSRLHQELEKMVIIDELTGIYNYRYFNLKLAEEKKRVARYGQPLSLIMVDLDWFKRCNDTFGHEAGNVVLKGVVQVVKQIVRDTDILCRYGGEEFIVILPQTGNGEALQIAERIRKEVEKSRFNASRELPPLAATVSVGITTYPDNGATEDDLVQLVDRAMYIAKGRGKNTVATV